MKRKPGQIKRLKNGKWLMRLESRQKDKPRKSISKVCASRDEAETALKEILEEIKKAKKQPLPAKKTFNELFDEYLTVIRPTIREQTYFLYERLIRSYLREKFGAMPVYDLSAQAIEKHYAVLLETLSPETVFKVHTQLKAALKKAAQWQWITQNPTAYVKPPKRAQKPKETLTPEELSEFFGACPDLASRAMWLFFALTGCRAQEVLAARWKDLDFENKLFRVSRVLIQTKQVKKFDEPKTENSRRVIPLEDALLEVLKKHKHEQNIFRLKSETWSDGDLIFPTTTGKPQRLSNLGEKMNRIKAKTTIEKRLTPHLLRHTFATLALKNGVSIKIVSEFLGHKTVKITLDIYSHINFEDKREASRAMSRILKIK